MITHVLVYVILAIIMGAMVYVIGTPWFTPKPRQSERKWARKDIGNAHK